MEFNEDDREADLLAGELYWYWSQKDSVDLSSELDGVELDS